MRLEVSAYTATTALGPGLDALWRGLENGRSGLRRCDFEGAELDTWIGAVSGCDETRLPPALSGWDCRNNRLAELGLQQDGFLDAVARVKQRHAPARIGLFLGTSTSGIGATEAAYAAAQDGHLPNWFDHERSHDYFSVCGYVRRRLGIAGPTMAISTACSSSAKVFAVAGRSMAAGFCDAAVVGGVDSLCLTTLYGFHSLQLMSREPCRPSDAARDGISIGEAAGFALLTPAEADSGLPAVLGWGESGDAWHMASPEPQGAGAELAMRGALDQAGLCAGDIAYINLHGTATRANDLAESLAIARLFGAATPVSSTKGWTGHTLGAAGIVEAVIGWLALRNHAAPRSLNTRAVDPAITTRVLLEHQLGLDGYVLTNSFGFGGSNCALVLA
ncbi:MAG: beta-ketoacyl-[acyl-carrier-protein] synthase family protein [Salinisphaera sp.]|nr:beta-ketoacyl-[acyl-carrier-protein] synthase family protein [Salinisphaera sp.]